MKKKKWVEIVCFLLIVLTRLPSSTKASLDWKVLIKRSINFR